MQEKKEEGTTERRGEGDNFRSNKEKGSKDVEKSKRVQKLEEVGKYGKVGKITQETKLIRTLGNKDKYVFCRFQYLHQTN